MKCSSDLKAGVSREITPKHNPPSHTVLRGGSCRFHPQAKSSGLCATANKRFLLSQLFCKTLDQSPELLKRLVQGIARYYIDHAITHEDKKSIHVIHYHSLPLVAHYAHGSALDAIAWAAYETYLLFSPEIASRACLLVFHDPSDIQGEGIVYLPMYDRWDEECMQWIDTTLLNGLFYIH